MKIVFLTRLYYPHIGGVERHVAQISKKLQEKGYEITVITEQYDKLLPQREDVDGVSVYRIPVGKNEKKKKFLIWKWMWQHRRLIKKTHIIHAHDVFFWILPLRFLYAYKPFFTTFHGYESYPIRSGAKRMRRLSANLSRGNICIGKFMEKWYRTEPTYISYGAIDIIPDKITKYPENSAVFIGRLDDQTGIRTYAEAFHTLKSDFPDFQLSVFGDGPLRKEIGEEVKLYGFVENAEREIPHFHFAFVSRYLTILEAFAAKRLVFAVYDNPVKEDYLRMTPFAKNVVISKTSDELVKKVNYYLNHPDDGNKLTESAYEWVKDQTWDVMVNLYEKLWEVSSSSKR